MKLQEAMQYFSSKIENEENIHFLRQTVKDAASLLEEYHKCLFNIAEKLDGQSGTEMVFSQCAIAEKLVDVGYLIYNENKETYELHQDMKELTVE